MMGGAKVLSEQVRVHQEGLPGGSNFDLRLDHTVGIIGNCNSPQVEFLRGGRVRSAKDPSLGASTAVRASLTGHMCGILCVLA